MTRRARRQLGIEIDLGTFERVRYLAGAAAFGVRPTAVAREALKRGLADLERERGVAAPQIDRDEDADDDEREDDRGEDGDP